MSFHIVRRLHNRDSKAIIDCQMNRERQTNRGTTPRGGLIEQSPASLELEWPLRGIVPRDRERVNTRAREQRLNATRIQSEIKNKL